MNFVTTSLPDTFARAVQTAATKAQSPPTWTKVIVHSVHAGGLCALCRREFIRWQNVSGSEVITIPDDIADAASIAQRSGQSRERLLLDALRVYFPPMPADLQAEFNALEQASDDDLLGFERRLEMDSHAAG